MSRPLSRSFAGLTAIDEALRRRGSGPRGWHDRRPACLGELLRRSCGRSRDRRGCPGVTMTLPFVSGTSYQTGRRPRGATVSWRIGSVDSVMSLWTGSAILSMTSCCASSVASQLTNLAAASCFSGEEKRLAV